MIFDGIIYIMTAFLRGVVASLPAASIPADIETSIGTAAVAVANIDTIFPLGTLVAVLAALTSVEVAVFGYKFLMWSLKKIPGVK